MSADEEQTVPRNGILTMGGYFKPIRRKIGVVALVFACVFTAGWIRSLVMVEAVICQVSRLGVSVISVDRHLGLLRVANLDLGQLPFPVWQSSDFQSLSTFIEQGDKPSWHGRILGFHAVTGSDMFHPVLFICCPYWAIIIPVTLLSAWQLLRKPRVKPEPVPSTNP